MKETVTLRPDLQSRAALELLARRGYSVSVTIREALVEAARTYRAELMRAEALALANDPLDRAEAAQVLREMQSLNVR
ncbi:MAG: hypothetical protein ACRC0L_04305 [Angustibacter sp.]